MNAKELLSIIQDDLKTNPQKIELQAYVDLMQHVADSHPESEVNPSATAQGLKKEMYEHAKKNQKNGSFAFGPTQSVSFAKKYMGINEGDEVLHSNAKHVNLEDFF